MRVAVRGREWNRSTDRPTDRVEDVHFYVSEMRFVRKMGELLEMRVCTTLNVYV